MLAVAEDNFPLFRLQGPANLSRIPFRVELLDGKSRRFRKDEISMRALHLDTRADESYFGVASVHSVRREPLPTQRTSASASISLSHPDCTPSTTFPPALLRSTPENVVQDVCAA